MFQLQQEGNQRQDFAPYPVAGLRPQGAPFILPSRQVQGPPRTIYGPPTTTTEQPTTELPTTTEYPSTTLEPESSQLSEERHVLAKSEEEENNDSELVEEVPVQEVMKTAPQGAANQGVYYVLLPTGQLQKVQYLTTLNDAQSAAYSTQLRYENVQPIQGPIYTFSSDAQLLQIVV